MSYASAPPFSAFVGNIDFNGDGTTGDLLPGTTMVDAFNRGMGPADLERLVTQFNQTYAGTTDAKGTPIRYITLPAHYSFGSTSDTLDLRVTRPFVIEVRWRVSVIGEMFNVYYKANLSGFSGDLTNPATFGQPTSRATQIFGSGGPRAVQLAGRVRSGERVLCVGIALCIHRGSTVSATGAPLVEIPSELLECARRQRCHQLLVHHLAKSIVEGLQVRRKHEAHPGCGQHPALRELWAGGLVEGS